MSCGTVATTCQCHTDTRILQLLLLTCVNTKPKDRHTFLFSTASFHLAAALRNDREMWWHCAIQSCKLSPSRRHGFVSYNLSHEQSTHQTQHSLIPHNILNNFFLINTSHHSFPIGECVAITCMDELHGSDNCLRQTDNVWIDTCNELPIHTASRTKENTDQTWSNSPK